VKAFEDRAAWAKWLAANHARSEGEWLKLARTGSNVPSVSYPEALEVALIWGWIDGQKRSLDKTHWLQRFCPRGPRSIWSKINRDKALKLIAGKKMKPAGLAAVERAKQNGSWDRAYDSPKTSTVPDDFAKALEPVQKAWDSLDSRNRYAMLFRIHHARKSETRAKRIAQFVVMLKKGQKLYP
jgi:uncharacterized protein YdeI (YjbR/CyaY-like superfamily)